MSLFETIEKDYVQAYKAKDAVRLTCLLYTSRCV